MTIQILDNVLWCCIVIVVIKKICKKLSSSYIYRNSNYSNVKSEIDQINDQLTIYSLFKAKDDQKL